MKKLFLILCMLSLNSFSINYVDNENFKEQIIFSATGDGKIIVDSNSDVVFPIASLTKVMNVLVALDEVEKGNFSLDDKITFDKETAYISGGRLFALPGDSYTLRDLLKMELVHSSNNSAYAVAKFIGKGSIENFVNKMNLKAKEIGLKNTEFASPAGLPPRLSHLNGMDVSNAKDLYLLTSYALKNYNILEYSNIKEIKLDGNIYENRNTLLGKYGIVGLKTGYHSESGYNFIVVSKMGDTEIISISLNSENIKDRNLVNERILKILEQNITTLVDKNNEYYIFDIANHQDKNIEGYLKEDIKVLDVYKNIKYNLVQLDYEDKDIKKDDKIAILEVYEGSEKLFEKDIFAVKENKRLKWYERILRIITFGYY
ncbi:D-alanyl-D-alanine carboxypeptidase family protein [Pseudostreptobacillus hongkongensis]|uniref:D-alanyl-D-alanine carboxypeptidase family protein n=1 Tax=Pseudostreptobacillus hongkongensis TaxID=1162717 RepID=UPI00082D4D14|nr:serine hydrolase [Pseudostreptobacillus hongkongensis]